MEPHELEAAIFTFLRKKLSLADFDITFSEHGKTFTVELDEENRKLLGLKR